MRNALAAVLIMAFGPAALAQRSSDRFDLSPNERQVQRDAQGRRTGTVEREASGRLVERDAQGRRTGTIERGTGRQLIQRDALGRRTGTIDRGR